MRTRSSESCFNYPACTGEKTSDALKDGTATGPIDRARKIRHGLLRIMQHIAEEEVTKHRIIATSDAASVTPVQACQEAISQILQDRVFIITTALNYIESSSSTYWNNVLHDVHTLYRNSVAQSIVNYILQDAHQRTRTSITAVPASFGWGWGHTRVLPSISMELRR